MKPEDLEGLVSLYFGADDVSESDRLVEDLGAESMDLVNIIATLEERYRVSVDEEEIPELRTIRDLRDLIRRRRPR